MFGTVSRYTLGGYTVYIRSCSEAESTSANQHPRFSFPSAGSRFASKFLLASLSSFLYIWVYDKVKFLVNKTIGYKNKYDGILIILKGIFSSQFHIFQMI